jgi:tRNA (guanine-N7-)-methyltransferase
MSENKSGKPLFYDPSERRIRSFVTRAGRVSVAQGRALEELGPRFLVPYDKAPLDLAATFARQAPTILEIGFGMGETSAKISALMPEKNFIGVEVHTPGVGSYLKLIGEGNLENVRIIQHDAVEVLTNMIAPDSLAGVHVFFPDPWHKARHNKRRLLQNETAQAFARILKPGGTLRFVTDWLDYAEWALGRLNRTPGLERMGPTEQDWFVPPADHVVTRYEEKKLGDTTPVFLEYRRVD